MTASENRGVGAGYVHGATPLKPADFEAFWQARMAEADAVPLDYTVTQAKEVPSWDSCDFLDPWLHRHGRCAYLRQISAAAQR